jgi:tRNA pseudouridine55 synthase
MQEAQNPVTELKPLEGILLINKPLKISSFGVISVLRRLTKVRKIGHCGTLDPLATGLLICLVGKNYTRLSDKLITQNKAYVADICLGASTTTYDKEGAIVNTSMHIPTKEQLIDSIASFQGKTMQTPPLFSAKKVGGVKACDAARQGKEVTLAACEVEMSIKLLEYNYPHLKVEISCSKGTYIRSFAHDLGIKLTTYAHLGGLCRIQSGSFNLSQAISLDELIQKPELLSQNLNHITYV